MERRFYAALEGEFGCGADLSSALADYERVCRKIDIVDRLPADANSKERAALTRWVSASDRARTEAFVPFPEWDADDCYFEIVSVPDEGDPDRA